jgi:hypothetical protein
MIQFICTQCGRRCWVSRNHAGKNVLCMSCGIVNHIPASHEKVSCGDSLADLNSLFEELSRYEKTAPASESGKLSQIKNV